MLRSPGAGDGRQPGQKALDGAGLGLLREKRMELVVEGPHPLGHGDVLRHAGEIAPVLLGAVEAVGKARGKLVSIL